MSDQDKIDAHRRKVERDRERAAWRGVHREYLKALKRLGIKGPQDAEGKRLP